MLNQLCLLICSMSRGTIYFQGNFVLYKTHYVYRDYNIRVNLQIKSQILSFFKKVVHYKFSYKIWI